MSVLTRLKTPHFRAGGIPEIDDETYVLEVSGLVAQPLSLNLEDLKSLPKSEVNARLTSVSGWSVRAVWEGILWTDFMKFAKPLPEATHVHFVSLGQGYETTISLKDLDHPRVVIVYAVEGEPLERLYGGPVRMVVPNLYGYKSAKWLGRIEFGDRMRGGYWEDRGYSREARIEPGVTLDVNTGERREIRGGEVLDF